MILECIKDSHTVVNCIGSEYPTLRFTLEQVNVEGVLRIARACKMVNVPKFIHISCMRASRDAPSNYLKTKVGHYFNY